MRWWKLFLVTSVGIAICMFDVAANSAQTKTSPSEELARKPQRQPLRLTPGDFGDLDRRRWQLMCAELRQLAERHKGEVSYAIKHLETGWECTYQADEPRPTASLIKLPVMIEAYRQAEEEGLDLQRKITIRQEDFVPGSGILTSLFSPGTTISLRDAIHLMIAKSDNTATNLVLNQIGIASTAQTMEKLGFKETKIHSLVFKRETSKFPERSERFGLGSTTAAEMLELLERLQRGELVSAAATQEIKTHLLACDDRTKLAARLPNAVKLAHKTGAISNVRCDAGLLETKYGTVVLIVLTSDNEDQSWGDSNAAQLLCAEIGRRVYDCVSDDSATAPIRILKRGATGQRVEDLQRTLNARLNPNLRLAIDGDFGPATEAAVREWQQRQGIETTGEVNAATWESLGTLVTEDEPVPDPEQINQQELTRMPQDTLTGPPQVTCKSWLILDLQSNEVVGAAQENERRDIASLTKLMTALVALKMADEDASLLGDTVEFSTRADETIGSTTGIRAGEQVPLHDLLYGLLLPSGNDAGVAIAEHLGQRLLDQDRPERLSTSDKDVEPGESAYDRFIRAMNETAESLHLEETHFKNPHGLTEAEHHSSAVDVASIAQAALEYEIFREIVNCRQYGVKVSSRDGYRRNLIWKNTNRLLQREGYAGVKTGTTSAAGACLVGLAERDGRQRLVVILGATSGDARYVDARNLFRWGWNQRAQDQSAND